MLSEEIYTVQKIRLEMKYKQREAEHLNYVQETHS